MDYKRLDLVGILATNEEVVQVNDRPGSRSVFINNGGDIQYQIKLISRLPKPDGFSIESKLFTGYMNSIIGYENHDDVNATPEERVESFRNFFNDYLFVFNYRLNYEYVKIDKANLIKKPSFFKEGDGFTAVPVFSPKEETISWESQHSIRLNRNYNNFDEFIANIKNGVTIGEVSKFEYKENPPAWIMWQDKDKTFALGPFKEPSSILGGYTLQYDYLGCINLDEGELDYSACIFDVNPTVSHIIQSKYDEIYNKLLKKQVDKLIDNKDEEETYEDKPVITKTSLIEEVITIDTSLKNDVTLIDLFRYYTQKSNLFYSDKDLINFHTAIKTGSLVILSGMSGTGKSRIVDAYAKTLGIQSSDTLIIPVRPSWNDDADLLGYVDLVHMVYRPSDTGFIKIIMEASKHKDQLYLICFDEMNLARIEHYFSQFLSILEKPEGQRELRLYDSAFKGKLYNSAEYEEVIEIRSNIKFIGTVNIDESTHHFSDKVLDRANVIKLDIVDFSNKDLWTSKTYGTINSQTWSANDFDALVKTETKGNIIRNWELRKFLWSLHNLLQTANGNLGIGPRIVKQIELYINNLPLLDREYDISVEEGFDIQVVQRILTKIRGSEEQLGQLLGTIKVKEDTKTIYDLLEEYSAISSFTRSKSIIEQKKKELKTYGYCI